MSFRDELIQARRDVHEVMSAPATFLSLDYLAAPSPALALLISVRCSDNRVQQGDQKGTNFNSALMEDDSPRLIFELDELPHIPKRNEIVILSATEGYIIDTTEAPDGITVTARCARMKESKIAPHPLPETLTP